MQTIKNIINRKGETIEFNGNKIINAIINASVNLNDHETPTVEQMHSIVSTIRHNTNISNVEQIQDAVEKELGMLGYHKLERLYISYRDKHEKLRELIKKNGLDTSNTILSTKHIYRDIKSLSKGLTIDIYSILTEFLNNVNIDPDIDQINTTLLLAIRTRIEYNFDYSYLAARITLKNTKISVYNTLGLGAIKDVSNGYTKEYIIEYITTGIECKRLSNKLSLCLDQADKLADIIVSENDNLFNYMGMQSIIDRYLIKNNSMQIIELPQMLFMRVALELSITSDDNSLNLELVKQYYMVLSNFEFMNSTPTLFNSGTKKSQLASCYLQTIPDNLAGIYKAISDSAQLSKWAGGLGLDWSSIRATNSRIEGTNGKSQGVIPFLKVLNDTAVAVNQCFFKDSSVVTINDNKIQCKLIQDVTVGSYTIGRDGTCRKITEAMTYPITDDLVKIKSKNSIDPIIVSAGHPYLGIKNIPKKMSFEKAIKSLSWKKKDRKTYKAYLDVEWIDANQLTRNSFIAQVIPTDIDIEHDLSVLESGVYNPTTEKIDFTFNNILNAENFRQNILMLGVATSGTRHDDDIIVHVPITQEINQLLKRFNLQTYKLTSKLSYFKYHNFIFSQIRSVSDYVTQDGLLYDFKVEGVKSYSIANSVVHNGGKRKGAACAYLEIWHLDLLDFLSVLKNTGDDRRRTHDINTAMWICDLFMERVIENGVWTLFSPSETPELHGLFGAEFKAKYEYYEDQASKGKLLNFKTHNAVDINRKLLSMNFETGNFWQCWKDACNQRSPQKHSGVVNSSNLCFRRDTIVDIPTLIPGCNNNIESLAEWSKGVKEFDVFCQIGGKTVIRKATANITGYDVVCEIQLNDNSAIYPTLDHEFFNNKNQLVPASKLHGSKLNTGSDTNITVIGVNNLDNEKVPVYCLTVPNAGNFYIKTNTDRILVKNCTEITLNTTPEETAVCNLGSINLPKYVIPNAPLDECIDTVKLKHVVSTAVRMLNTVIDNNFYPTKEALNSNLAHRPIGLGIMGFQDALHELKYAYESKESIAFANYSMALISYYAIEASHELAMEYGSYSTFEGSTWSKGLVPLDTIKFLHPIKQKTLDETSHLNLISGLDWDALREKVKKGMRNSNVMAIAPTASIGNICDSSQSIEPSYKNLYVKSSLSGEFTTINKYLINELIELNLWNDRTINEIKKADGSIQNIDNIPDDIKLRYKTAFELDMDYIIDCAKERQKYIDQSQSLNLYQATLSGRALKNMYYRAWKSGLKTTYYLRSLNKTTSSIEKNTVIEDAKVCNIDDGECEACQ